MSIPLENLPGEWRFEAACDPTTGDAYFPTPGQNPNAAKATCRACPVRTQCLAYALEHNERVGIWGGLSPAERRLRRKTGQRVEEDRGADGRLHCPDCDASYAYFARYAQHIATAHPESEAVA